MTRVAIASDAWGDPRMQFAVEYTNDYGLRELARRLEERLPEMVGAREAALLRSYFEAVRAGRAAYGPAVIAEAVAQGRVRCLLALRGTPLPAGYAGEVQWLEERGDEASRFRRGFGGLGAWLRY